MALKMLIISPCIPYDNMGHAGGKTHNYYLKKFHESEEFEVKLITFSFPDDLKKQDLDRYGIDYKVIIFSRKFIARIIRFIWRKINTLNIFDKRGAFIAPYFKKAIIEALKKLKINGYQPDIILMEWTQIVLMINEIKKIFPKAYYISSEVEVSFLSEKRSVKFYKGINKYFKNKYFKNKKIIELFSVKSSNLTITQSIEDKKLLITEGINSKKIYNICPYYFDMFDVKPDYTSNNIIFFGAMGRIENYLSVIWFINHVFSKIIKKYPNSKLFIVGSNPPNKLLNYQSCKNIIVTGFVSNPKIYFKISNMMVAPLVSGGGIKVKVLEGMSSALPVITNNIGIEGIPAREGIEYLHAEAPKEYIKHITNIFENHNYASKIGKSARKFIKKEFSTNDSFKDYKKRILKDIIAIK